SQDVVLIDSTEIYAESGSSRVIRNGRMQMLRREEHKGSRPADKDLPVEINLLLKVRMIARIVVNVEGSVFSAFCIPSVRIEIRRIIRNLASEVAWVDDHRVSFLNFVDWGPPIDLTGRRRVPDISMGLVCVAHARCQI